MTPHPFTPHLTIGRVKSPRNRPRLCDAVAAASTAQARLKNALESRHDDVIGRQRVDHFTLYRSTLTSDGPIHEKMERFLLGVSE